MAGGRPTDYTPEIAAEICKLIAEGSSLRAIGESDTFPDTSTIRRWLAKEENEEFRLQYARAREEQADHYADEIIEIADTAKDANLARLRVDARKWKASKLAPKKYGDRITHAGDETSPIVTKDLSASEHARRIAFALRDAQRETGREDSAGGDEASEVDAEPGPAD